MHLPDSAASQDRSGQLWQNASRVAFFGGSFDPPHLGHLAVARAARAAFRLDAVLFAPVGSQPLKPEGSTATFEHRVAMTRLAIEGEQGFVLSLADAPKAASRGRAAPNYTIDTLEGLRAILRPEATLYCLMGADSFAGLRRWYRASEISFVAQLIVASRPGQPLAGLRNALPDGLTLEPAPGGDRNVSGIEVRAFSLMGAGGERAAFYVLPGLDVEISATEIRAHLRGGAEPASACTLLPPAVVEYIRAHDLYR